MEREEGLTEGGSNAWRAEQNEVERREEQEPGEGAAALIRAELRRTAALRERAEQEEQSYGGGVGPLLKVMQLRATLLLGLATAEATEYERNKR